MSRRRRTEEDRMRIRRRLKKPLETHLYCATHTATGRMYVGVTKLVPPKRWSQHLRAARHGSKRTFATALREHGREAFEWEVLHTYENTLQAHNAERELIACLMLQDAAHGFNDAAGGQGSGPVSEAARARIKVAASAGRERERLAREAVESKAREAESKARVAAFLDRLGAARDPHQAAEARAQRAAEARAKISAATTAYYARERSLAAAGGGGDD
jgi:hypothetical protein